MCGLIEVTQADRERIAAALLRGLERAPAVVRDVLEAFAVEDVAAIEPIVDQIIARERALAAEATK